jgi:protoheme IX farnesyltransferase
MNDAVAIDSHAGALVITSRLRSVHTLITVRTGRQFTRVVNEIDIARWFLRARCSKQIATCGFEPQLVVIRVTCIGSGIEEEPRSYGVSTRERADLSRSDRIREKMFDYLALTKPRMIHVVVGAIPAMLLAERGTLAPLVILNTLIGTTLMQAGANTLNCVADADIDKLMKRTSDRPLARAAVSNRHALVFGLALSVASVSWLWWTTYLLAGLLAVATIAFYAVVYTLLLKRRTSQYVVWGGIVNAMPVMIGWSAVTGTIGWPALIMFAIIVFWTPPHSWALAIRHTEDYRAAGIPMLPVVATEPHVANQILVYTWLSVIAALALSVAAGWLYAAVALAAGAWSLMTAHGQHARAHRGMPLEPLRLFRQSNNYLAVVFCALALDSALALPTLLGQ